MSVAEEFIFVCVNLFLPGFLSDFPLFLLPLLFLLTYSRSVSFLSFFLLIYFPTSRYEMTTMYD